MCQNRQQFDMHNLFFLINPVLRCEWLHGQPAYECNDGALVRACMEMLKAGVRAMVPGELPSDSAKLAQICGIEEEKVIDHWEALTHGWVLTTDGNLRHDGVAKYCHSMMARFGDKIEEIHARIADLEGCAQMLADGPMEPKTKKGASAKSAHAGAAGRPVFGSAKSRVSAAIGRSTQLGKERAL